MSPILSRGNEHASVLVYHVDPKDPPLRFYKKDFFGLGTVGHWFMAPFTNKYVSKPGLHSFSPDESYVDVQPDETLVLRIHHWVAHQDQLRILLPTATHPKTVKLLAPQYRRPKIWTHDLSSRILFSMLRQEFQRPDRANKWLKRMFLPVPNKALCYLYFSSVGYSHFAVDIKIEGKVPLFITYYDKAGHAFAGERIEIGEGQELIPVNYPGAVILGRVVTHTQAKLDTLLGEGTLMLQTTTNRQVTLGLNIFNDHSWHSKQESDEVVLSSNNGGPFGGSGFLSGLSYNIELMEVANTEMVINCIAKATGLSIEPSTDVRSLKQHLRSDHDIVAYLEDKIYDEYNVSVSLRPNTMTDFRTPQGIGQHCANCIQQARIANETANKLKMKKIILLSGLRLARQERLYNEDPNVEQLASLASDLTVVTREDEHHFNVTTKNPKEIAHIVNQFCNQKRAGLFDDCLLPNPPPPPVSPPPPPHGARASGNCGNGNTPKGSTKGFFKWWG